MAMDAPCSVRFSSPARLGERLDFLKVHKFKLGERSDFLKVYKFKLGERSDFLDVYKF